MIEEKGSDDWFTPDCEMNMITLSEGQLDRQSRVDSDRTTAPDEEIASGPVSGYRSRFFLG